MTMTSYMLIRDRYNNTTEASCLCPLECLFMNIPVAFDEAYATIPLFPCFVKVEADLPVWATIGSYFVAPGESSWTTVTNPQRLCYAGRQNLFYIPKEFEALFPPGSGNDFVNIWNPSTTVAANVQLSFYTQ